MNPSSRRKMRSSHVFLLIASLVIFSFLVIFLSDADTDTKLSQIPLQKSFINMVIAEEEDDQHHRIRHNFLEAVLFPDWEVLVLSNNALLDDDDVVTCTFHNGAVSKARRGSDRTYFCSMPNSVRRLRPFYAPKLNTRVEDSELTEMARWNRLVYESLSTDDDVIVFAKGVNRQSVNPRPVSELRCVFITDRDGVVSESLVTSSSQEVFRCAHPNMSSVSDIRVSIRTVDNDYIVPTVAAYKQQPVVKYESEKKFLCAATMVYNATKFLPEWIKYHAAIGVEKFILYDNGSEDDLLQSTARIDHDIDVVYWPWSKTQEAGFSHAASAYRDECEWVAFIDVDEFVFLPEWEEHTKPDKSMLPAIVPKDATTGQVSLRCLEFGPSGRETHPSNGVTQGYTCRRRVDNRHKSLVRLEAVGRELSNSIHHFVLGGDWSTMWVPVREGVVNHYKYQAWEEFRVKFRRRASSYVADWKERTNVGSNDRTPGLGFEAVEPDGWARRFCEVVDTRVADVARRWFGGADGKMAWEE